MIREAPARFDLPFEGLTESRIDAFFEGVDFIDRVRLLNDYIGAVDDSTQWEGCGHWTPEGMYIATKDIVLSGVWQFNN